MGESEYVLADTQLEERDGCTWVSGLCPGCGERSAYRAVPRGAISHVRCPNGHQLRIVEQTSAVSHAVQRP
jgi:hypothetical protein